MNVSISRLVHAFALSLAAASGVAGASPVAPDTVTYVNKTLVSTTAKSEVFFDSGPVGVVQGPVGAADGPCPNHAKVRTDWPADKDVTLRRKFVVPEGARKVKVNVGVTGTAYVFVNGQIDDLGVIVEWRCAERESRHGVEADIYVRPGVNRIEIMASGDEDRFIAFSITADVPIDAALSPQPASE